MTRQYNTRFKKEYSASPVENGQESWGEEGTWGLCWSSQGFLERRKQQDMNTYLSGRMHTDLFLGMDLAIMWAGESETCSAGQQVGNSSKS